MTHWSLAVLAIVAASADAAPRRISATAATTPATARIIRTTRPATAPTTARAKIAPEAKPLLDAMKAAYATLKSIELAGVITGEFDVAGSKHHKNAEFSAAFLAPASLRHDVKDEMLVLANADHLYVLGRQTNEYAAYDAPKARTPGARLPGSVRELLLPATPPANISSNPSLLLALSPDAAEELATQASEIARGADVVVDGKAHPSLELSFAAMSVKMTILLDPQTHLVRRTIADVKGLMEQARTPDVKVATITVDYAKVSPEAKLDAAHFAWTPPAGARPISPSSAPPERDHGHDDEEDER